MNGGNPSKKLFVAAVVLVAVEVAACALLPRGLALTAISDVVDALLLLFAFLAFTIEGLANKGRVRWFWLLQAGGWALWFGDQLVWIAYDLVWRQKMPPMSGADALLFLAGAPMFAGVLLRPHRRPSPRSARVGVLDFSLLALWWLFLYVSFVVCWQLYPNEEAYNRNFDWLSGVQSVLLACVAVSFWLTSSGRWKTFYAFFCGTVVFNGIAFYVLNRAIEMDVYYTGSWYDVPYSASFAAFSALAVLGRGLLPIGEAETDESYNAWSYTSWMSNVAMAAVLSLPLIAAYTLFDGHLPHEAAHFRVLVSLATMFAMALLLFIRHNLLNRELRNSNVVLEEASLTDPLSGLRNRRYFSATIEADASQALRAHADGLDARTRDLVFYLVDADNFKEVNDLYGHDIGDQVLIEMSRRLSTSIRHSDVLVRWGGEEFLIVSRYTNRDEAELLAERVLSAVADTPFALGRAGKSMYRTCSLGWAAFPWFLHDPRGIGYEEVLALADCGLREAKKSGKNCAVGMLPATGTLSPSSNQQLQYLGLQVEVLSVTGPRSTR